jgi:hypothetical protein
MNGLTAFQVAQDSTNAHNVDINRISSIDRALLFNRTSVQTK